MTSPDNRNAPTQVDDEQGTDEILRANRELTRQELADTVSALAHKADLPARSKEAAREYQARASRAALNVGERATLQRTMALAGSVVLAIGVLAIVRSRRRG